MQFRSSKWSNLIARFFVGKGGLEERPQRLGHDGVLDVAQVKEFEHASQSRIAAASMDAFFLAARDDRSSTVGQVLRNVAEIVMDR